MSSDIQLQLVNQSNDVNNSQIIIFQKDITLGRGSPPVAWKVLPMPSPGGSQPFTYPIDLQLSADDGQGHSTAPFSVTPGETWDLERASDGAGLVASLHTRFHFPPAPRRLHLGTSPLALPGEVQLRNALTEGSINARIYRDGHLLASAEGIAPGQQAGFALTPKIFIGVASNVQQGQVLDPATVAVTPAELSLDGIQSADIVMTGGGPGTSTPVQFTLQNVKRG
jgi:hypothetical protein